MKHVTRHITLAATGFILAMMSTGCDVHEFPVEIKTDPPPDEHTLTLVFDDSDFDYYTTVNINGDRSTRSHEATSSHYMRYIVRAYRLETDRKTSRVSSRSVIDYHEGTAADYGAHTDYTIPLVLDEGEYDILAWAEHVPAGTAADYYYDTTDFYELALSGVTQPDYSHRGNNAYREAWRGYTRIKVTADGRVVTGDSREDVTDVKVEMDRPLARFHFVTTDLEEFTSRVMALAGTGPVAAPTQTPDLKDYRIVMHYPQYMPSAYNLLTDKPIDSRKGVSFEGVVRAVDNNEAELSFDYVFVNGTSSSVQVALELYRRDNGQLLSSTGTIDVPVTRGHYTVVKGPLLTTSAGAGIGINTDYTGEFNIEIH